MTHYIAINGPPDSGRSTIAKMFQKRITGSVQSELHAPLKQLFCTGLGMSWHNLKSQNPRDVLNGRTSIDALRQLRYHLKGLYGPDVLAQWLNFRVLGMNPKPEFVIVDDILYADDADLLKQNSLTLIRIIRGKENNFTAISNPDYTVINANGLDYLAKRVDQILGAINHARPRRL